MIFGTSQRLALTVIRVKANIGRAERWPGQSSISTCSLDLTLLQAQCLNDPSEEQFDALFAIVVEVVLILPSLLRQSLR